MVKHLVVVFLIGMLLVATLPPGVTAQENENLAYAARGPYAVGTMELVVEDAERPLDVTVWYPALNPENLPEEVTYGASPPLGATELLPVSGHALADAAPNIDDGPFPLVIFSHGLWGFRHSSVYLTEHLASYGFVVIAPDHFGDNMADLGNPDMIDSHIYRPLDVTRLIDFATAEDSVLQDLIDANQIAVIGHSFGGYTALASAGARLHFGEFDELYCQDADFVSRDYGLCRTINTQHRLAQVAGLDETPDGLFPSFGDERIDAIVPMAAAETTLFAHTGLQDVTVPVLFMAGSMDMIPAEYYTYEVYENISSKRKALVTFDDAGHLVFVNTCDVMPWQPDKRVCSDPIWDMDHAHDLINHFVTAFLLAEFYGNVTAVTALSPEGIQFPGITYETIGY